MRYSGTRVLVTGPGGFLGTPLCEALVAEGASVRALLRRGGGWLDRSPVGGELERVAGDVRDPEAVLRATQGVDLVFHLAGVTTVPQSVADPRGTWATNVDGTLNVLEACRAHEAKLVLASSSQVYGQARYVPIDEAHPLAPRSPYAASKLAQEALVEGWRHSYGLRATTLRTFFTYGPRQSTRSIVPTVICQLLDGPRIRLGNLFPERDFVHVDDQVRGYLLAGLSEAAEGRCINLAGLELVSIGSLVQRVGRLLGVEPQVEQDPSRVRPRGSELVAVHGDSSLAAELLGWRPEIPIDEGLADCVAWYREHRALFG